MAQAKTARWLDLIAFLLQRKYPVDRDEIFRRVRGYGLEPDDAGPRAREAARRKFERDKDDLRGLGIAIETLPLAHRAADQSAAAYRLRPAGFYLPYFELDQGAPPAPHPYADLPRVPLSRREARVLDRATRRLAQRAEFPLVEAARSLRRKLAFDLPLSDPAVERMLADPLPPQGQAALDVLQRAVAQRRAVTCRYYSFHRDQEADRDIEPWGLFFERGRWYCVGRARDRDAARVFRVDRMRQANLLPGEEPFEVPAGFDVREYLGLQPWEMGDEPTVVVRVRFGFPQSRWVLNEGRGRVVEPALEDGGAIVEFEVKDLDGFLRWVLSFRHQATILEPPEAAAALAELRIRVGRLYER
jgi:proteasome accessory factor B